MSTRAMKSKFSWWKVDVDGEKCKDLIGTNLSTFYAARINASLNLYLHFIYLAKLNAIKSTDVDWIFDFLISSNEKKSSFRNKRIRLVMAAILVHKSPITLTSPLIKLVQTKIGKGFVVLLWVDTETPVGYIKLPSRLI